MFPTPTHTDVIAVCTLPSLASRTAADDDVVVDPETARGNGLVEGDRSRRRIHMTGRQLIAHGGERCLEEPHIVAAHSVAAAAGTSSCRR